MNTNIKILESLIVNWIDTSTNLVNIEARLFIKNGEEEIESKVRDTKEAIASRGIQYGLKYEDIIKKYGLNENIRGNLLGDYKNNLISINKIYKKAYKSVMDAKIQTTGELKKILTIIVRLKDEKVKLEKNFIDYQRYRIRLKKLIEKVKIAIKNGLQNEALELSNEITKEKENDPLKEYNNKLKLFINQLEVYNEILVDCENKMESYDEERKKKFEKAIIIKPTNNKSLNVKKSFFNKK